jgi:hypothetical protein
MRSVRLFTCVALLSVTTSAGAAEDWSYHGIRLAAKMTKAQIMHALGADKFTNNPTIDVWNNTKGCGGDHPDIQKCEDASFNKYGLMAVEYETSKIGPYCSDKQAGDFYCDNPWMGSLPNWDTNGHGVVGVFVSVHNGVVSEIDIRFDSAAADEVFGIVKRQLGGHWKMEQQAMSIGKVHGPDTKLTSKDYTDVTRTIWTRETPGEYAEMTDYDVITQHVSPIPFQGTVTMRLQDQHL